MDVRPEDTTLFRPPWWSGLFIQRARDAAPEPADASWLRVAMHEPGARFEAVCAAAGVPSELPSVDMSDPAARVFYSIVADHAIVDWVGILASSDNPPDLIMAEFLTTDSLQHSTGYRSALSQWSVAQADVAFGRLLQRLRDAGVEDQWNIAVMSDHGHSAVETALHPSVIIPGVQTQCEGGCLLVVPRDMAELAHVTERLVPYGVEPYPNTCVPAELRDQVFVFAAPAGVSFEDDNPDETEPTGKPANTSTHGLRPGMAGDDRFALFAGPNIPTGCIPEGSANQVAPTFAAILGLPLDDFPAPPLFQPRA
jgi:predicted AlkP superfamily pyrophosphatase or phosphodiesterase